MIPWPPAVTPLTVLPTIPRDPRVPEAYFAMVQTGQWPRRDFCPTPEPTSESLTGAAIHAFAGPGPRLASPLPGHLLPFAADGARYWCFDLTTPGPAIRYIDWEVDQWLTVADSFAQFLNQLKWVPPILTAAPTAQEFAHAALITDAAALPALCDYARTTFAAEHYGEWLAYWLTQPGLAGPARAELDFARQFRWAAFSPALRQRLAAWL